MNKLMHLIVLAAVAAFSIWLFMDGENHRPGDLRQVHEQSGLVCMDCHDEWKGVQEDNCKLCHEFAYASGLEPKIRFHGAGEKCLECHTEHKGAAKATEMDHTLLHPDLTCSRCHLEPHEGLFGEDCRACHGIETWSIEGYRHPPREERQCAECHKAPLSHRDEEFWSRIQRRHHERAGEKIPRPEECWRCHVTHDWRHLMM